MMDGTSTTDAAIERKLAAAVKRHASVKVKLAYAEQARARAQAIEALVRKTGVKDLEVTIGIVTHVPPQPPPGDPPPGDPPPMIVLTVAANGKLMLDARVVADAALDQELAVAAKTHPRLAIAPDGSTTALAVNKLLQRAKAAGFTDVIFLTK
jgi:hypothetical protein